MKFHTLYKWLVVFMQPAIFYACTKTGADTPTISNPPASTVPVTSISARPQINSTLTMVGTLSQARNNIAIVTAGNKIFFAGGSTGVNQPSATVDIYDISTNSWTTAALSLARSGIAAAALGNKVYFAGGFEISYKFASRVDIYNIETNSWTVSELPDCNQYLTGAAAGNKVVFAGGATANIFDVVKNSWQSPQILSTKPGEGCCPYEVDGISSTVIGDSIFFAGGVGWDYHNTIDIYNVLTGTWSVSKLNEYRGFAAAIAVGNSNYWAGGTTFNYGEQYIRFVEIRDVKSAVSKVDTLFQANAYFSAAHRNDTIVFFTGRGYDKNKFDIYSTIAKTWSIGILPSSIFESEIISANNSFYVAGGKWNGVNTDRLWKLDF